MNKTKRTEAEQQALLAYIRERYVYEPESGLLRHKGHGKPVKPLRGTQPMYLQISFWWKGKVIRIDYHRAVWFYCKGTWPEVTIDHINGDSKDNRIENLRECSLGENRLNMEHPWMANTETGVPGVEKCGTRYRTKIRGKRMYFSSPYEAFCIATLCGKRYKEPKKDVDK